MLIKLHLLKLTIRCIELIQNLSYRDCEYLSLLSFILFLYFFMIILYLGVVFSYTNAWTCGETNVISQSRLKVVNENLIWGKKSLHQLSQEKERR